MKSLVKLLFIIFCFFASVCVNAQSLQAPEINSFGYMSAVETSVPVEQFCAKLVNTDAVLVASNTQASELSALNDRRDNTFSGSLDRACAQNKLLQQILNANYNQLYNSTSHNISSYLKNEICARAP